MLVLSRKNGETLWTGDEIEITVCEIRNGRVRLGIDCPRHVKIQREELLELGTVLPKSKPVEV